MDTSALLRKEVLLNFMVSVFGQLDLVHKLAAINQSFGKNMSSKSGRFYVFGVFVTMERIQMKSAVTCFLL